MEANITLTPMDCIEKIHQFSQSSFLRLQLFEAVPNEIKSLAAYLKVESMEAVLFANSFAMWYETDTFSKIFRYFGLKEFQVLKYRKEISSLYTKGLLINQDKSNKKINSFNISQTVLNTVSENKEVKHISKAKSAEIILLVDILENFAIDRDRYEKEEIYLNEFFDNIEETCQENKEMPFFKEINKLKLGVFDTYLLMDTVWDAVKAGDNNFNTGLQTTVDNLFGHKSESMRVMQKILNGDNKLIKKDLIVLSREQFLNRTLVKLSDRMVNFLRKHEQLNIDNISENHRNLITAGAIPARQLLYNPEENSQVQNITSVLSAQKFKQLHQHLKEKNMPLGLAVLFHGVAGTGKTETVYQIAKQTGRNIFKVDIAETKSKWFGESQKLIKDVFNSYKDFCRSEENTPILLFNEADAVIGKRKAAGGSNVADTENAIQNIILEEMENFEGILFATTNLVENMDAAFERRFLFKIQFKKPSVENAAKIWNLKLPFLTEKECRNLATQFNFSGGEMENIARKVTMHEILNGAKPTLEIIEEMCRQEKWDEFQETRKIGFV